MAQNAFQSGGPMFVRRRLCFERFPALRGQRKRPRRDGVG
jgi:hypothetical protein